MKLLHLSKRSWQRSIINYKRSTRISSTKGLFEAESLQICRNLIHCDSVELLFDPDGDRRFIIYDAMQIKVIIKDNQIILSNHTYYYELQVSVEGIKSLCRVFDGHIQIKRDILETQIRNNAKDTLNEVIKVTSYLFNKN